LNDSQHIGHSSPSSLLALEQTSSSEHSAQLRIGSVELLFILMLVRACDAKFHIVKDEKFTMQRQKSKQYQYISHCPTKESLSRETRSQLLASPVDFQALHTS
jgi:hypothetical protein